MGNRRKNKAVHLMPSNVTRLRDHRKPPAHLLLGVKLPKKKRPTTSPPDRVVELNTAKDCPLSNRVR